ncbi:MAG: DUF4238 domain-containing protein [Bacteriovoracia bacterium]
MAVPRKHHYVPECYLINFTDTEKDSRIIQVFSKEKKTSFKTSVSNVGHIRDFYRLDASEGIDDEFGIETKMLAPMEGAAAPVLRKIIQEEKLPEDPVQLARLWTFIAFLAMRGPLSREHAAEVVDRTAKDWAQAFAAKGTPQDLKVLYDRMNTPERNRMNLEQLKDIANSKHYKFKTTQNYILSLTLDYARRLAPLLAKRDWCILVASSGQFITSDQPVLVHWSRRVRIKHGRGFGSESNELIVPLSPRICLSGTFEPGQKKAILSADSVSKLNAEISKSPCKFLFFRDKNFLQIKPNGRNHQLFE